MKSSRWMVGFVVLVALGFLPGCTQEVGEVCEAHPDGTNDCAAGLSCCGYQEDVSRGLCQATCTEPDAGPAPDAGPDAGAAPDAGEAADGGHDAGPVVVDAGTDAGTDAGPLDAGPLDAGPDAGDP